MLEAQRWDDVAYLMGAFVAGKPATESVYQSGEIDARFVTLSQDNWTGEGHVIDTTNGAQVYADRCATCHGQDGSGNGPGTVGSASLGPAAFPSDLPEAYIFWRAWEGVPDTLLRPARGSARSDSGT